ncbi:MAG: hypothetical protein NWF10_00280, partial [Candidatus Bathyarchaeota archaeon]|nr:hypothetical protein [Candidatus Bathyarchaeota archaeon]
IKQTHSTLSSEIFSMLTNYVESIESLKKDITPIHVDEIASRLSRFYEKIRKIIDWQEDNVLRRRATERILKRILFSRISKLSVFNKVETDDLAETVTTELIRGGHLPNNVIPREVIPAVSAALSKYLFFLEQSHSSTPVFDIKKQVNFTTFIIETAACELEEILANPIKEYALLEAMTNAMGKRIKLIPPDALSKDEKRRQTFIAVCRTLFDLDDAFIIYRLFDLKYSDWKNPDESILEKRFKQVIDFWENSDSFLDYPLAKDFKHVCDQNDTVFALLSDFLEEKKEKEKTIISIFENRKKFRKKIGELYDKRYQTLKRRLFRLGVFSTLSVFLSNWFTFYIVEVPLAKLFYERFSLFTAFIDFLIPTAVMFILVIIIRPPSKANRKRVLDTTDSFIYKNEKKKLYEIREYRKTHPILKTLYAFLYLFLTWLVFTIIGATFFLFQLPTTSVVFDTFTIALTVFAAVVIRNKSKELDVDDKTSVFEFILDTASVPIAKVGAFFARTWKEYNVVAIFFNFVIETPFAIILDTIEGWSQFLKDRKAELR